jgi:hypothetical protein
MLTVVQRTAPNEIIQYDRSVRKFIFIEFLKLFYFILADIDKFRLKSAHFSLNQTLAITEPNHEFDVSNIFFNPDEMDTIDETLSPAELEPASILSVPALGIHEDLKPEDREDTRHLATVVAGFATMSRSCSRSSNYRMNSNDSNDTVDTVVSVSPSVESPDSILPSADEEVFSDGALQPDDITHIETIFDATEDEDTESVNIITTRPSSPIHNISDDVVANTRSGSACSTIEDAAVDDVDSPLQTPDSNEGHEEHCPLYVPPDYAELPSVKMVAGSGSQDVTLDLELEAVFTEAEEVEVDENPRYAGGDEADNKDDNEDDILYSYTHPVYDPLADFEQYLVPADSVEARERLEIAVCMIESIGCYESPAENLLYTNDEACGDAVVAEEEKEGESTIDNSSVKKARPELSLGDLTVFNWESPSSSEVSVPGTPTTSNKPRIPIEGKTGAWTAPIPTIDHASRLKPAPHTSPLPTTRHADGAFSRVTLRTSAYAMPEVEVPGQILYRACRRRRWTKRETGEYSSGGDFKDLADANAKVKDAAVASGIQNYEEEFYDHDGILTMNPKPNADRMISKFWVMKKPDTYRGLITPGW